MDQQAAPGVSATAASISASRCSWWPRSWSTRVAQAAEAVLVGRQDLLDRQVADRGQGAEVVAERVGALAGVHRDVRRDPGQHVVAGQQQRRVRLRRSTGGPGECPGVQIARRSQPGRSSSRAVLDEHVRLGLLDVLARFAVGHAGTRCRRRGRRAGGAGLPARGQLGAQVCSSSRSRPWRRPRDAGRARRRRPPGPGPPGRSGRGGCGWPAPPGRPRSAGRRLPARRPARPRRPRRPSRCRSAPRHRASQARRRARIACGCRESVTGMDHKPGRTCSTGGKSGRRSRRPLPDPGDVESCDPAASRPAAGSVDRRGCRQALRSPLPRLVAGAGRGSAVGGPRAGSGSVALEDPRVRRGSAGPPRPAPRQPGHGWPCDAHQRALQLHRLGQVQVQGDGSAAAWRCAGRRSAWRRATRRTRSATAISGPPVPPRPPGRSARPPPRRPARPS